MSKPDWPDYQLESLRRLWAQGKTASQIEKELAGQEGQHFRSRSAILGKARRLDLDSRPHPINRVTPPPRQPSPTGMRAFELLDRLVADRGMTVREASEAANVAIDRAREHFRALRDRYDYGLPATARDDFVTPVRR